jgi:hypothetical protein
MTTLIIGTPPTEAELDALAEAGRIAIEALRPAA